MTVPKDERRLDVYTELPDVSKGQPDQLVSTKLLSISATDLDDINTRVTAGRPWRWILFCCGVIVGTRFGTLSYSRTKVVQVPLDAPVVESTVVYFHVPEAERPNLRTVEPSLCANRLGSRTSTTERHNDTNDVVGRDQGICVCSDYPVELCDGAHLVPHLKGDTYITTLTAGLQGDEVTDIDDQRNIILLSATLHRALGKTFAIMPKPNFAYPEDDRAWVPHGLRSYVLTNPTCRVPADISSWPPDILFYQVYAAAVLHTFGSHDSTGPLSHLSSAYYGPDGPMNSTERAERARRAEEEAMAQRANGNNEARSLRAARRRTADDMLEENAMEERALKENELKEISASVPMWFFALNAETQQTWLDGVLSQREAARASQREHVARWRQESAVV